MSESETKVENLVAKARDLIAVHDALVERRESDDPTDNPAEDYDAFESWQMAIDELRDALAAFEARH